MSETVFDSISKCYLFAELDEEVLERIARRCTVQRFGARETLFQLGDEADGMRIVLDGMVRVWMNDVGGDERTLRYLGPSDVFGEIALIDGLARTTNVTTEEETRCVYLPRAEFLGLLESNLALNAHLVFLLCERLRYCIEDIGDLTFLNVRQRLCRKLHELMFDHAKIDGGSARFTRKFSQGAIAKTIGASREATNRQLLALTREGMISMDCGFVIVNDVERLSRAAEGIESEGAEVREISALP